MKSSRLLRNLLCLPYDIPHNRIHVFYTNENSTSKILQLFSHNLCLITAKMCTKIVNTVSFDKILATLYIIYIQFHCVAFQYPQTLLCYFNHQLPTFPFSLSSLPLSTWQCAFDLSLITLFKQLLRYLPKVTYRYVNSIKVFFHQLHHRQEVRSYLQCIRSITFQTFCNVQWHISVHAVKQGCLPQRGICCPWAICPPWTSDAMVRCLGGQAHPPSPLQVQILTFLSQIQLPTDGDFFLLVFPIQQCVCVGRAAIGAVERVKTLLGILLS